MADKELSVPNKADINLHDTLGTPPRFDLSAMIDRGTDAHLCVRCGAVPQEAVFGWSAGLTGFVVPMGAVVGVGLARRGGCP